MICAGQRPLVLLALALACVGLAVAAPRYASALPNFSVWTVDTTAADPGVTMTTCSPFAGTIDCSLQGAMHNANQHAGADTIDFQIAASGVQLISLTSPLENVTGPLTIDGTTEVDSGQQCIDVLARPCVVINGAGAGAGANGLDLTVQGVTVKGLAIVGFSGAGIRSENASGNITIVRNFIGTADGTTASPNGTGISAAADNPNYVIGGTTAAERNVISGNTGTGIVAGSGTPINHVIRGNFIGVTASGSGDLGNGGDGIELIGPHTVGGTDPGAGNVISGNSGAGVRVFSNENVLQGNLIGTSADGLSAIPNNPGVLVTSQASATIGGTDAAARNVISGNNSFGIDIALGIFGESVVQGNYIGVDITGAAMLGNSGDGVHVSSFSLGTDAATIGGPEAGAGNVITGNSHGVVLTDHVSNSTVQNNYIGLNAAGTAKLGNQGRGVSLQVNGQLSENDSFIGNVIGGNDGGIELTAEGAGGEIRGSVISGNLVGLNAAGTQVLPNGDAVLLFAETGGTVHDNMIDDSAGPNIISGNAGGVELFGGDGVHDNTVTGNMIDGNGVGVAIGPGVPHNVIGSNTITESVGDGVIINLGANHILLDSNTITKNVVGIASRGDDITVQHNFIGTNRDLDPGLGNTASGIVLNGDRVVIGEAISVATAGDALPEAATQHGNVIWNNGLFGVSVESGTSRISGNSIDNNGMLGIDVGHGTAPVLTAATAGSVHVTGSLTSTPGTTFTIEFFASPQCDSGGSGEGRDYLGSMSVSTLGNGVATIDATLNAHAAGGEAITATAIDPLGNTSAFSNCVTMVGPTATPSPTPSPTPTGGTARLGDADCDGEITVDDVLATLSESGGVDPGAECADSADVDCDHDVDANDALRILLYLAGTPMAPAASCGQVGSPA